MYLILVDQPWRHFILGLSIANRKLWGHFYDHLDGAISPVFNINANPQHFIFIIDSLTFGCQASIRFNPTVNIHPPPLNRWRCSACEVALNTKQTDDDPGPTQGASISFSMIRFDLSLLSHFHYLLQSLAMTHFNLPIPMSRFHSPLLTLGRTYSDPQILMFQLHFLFLSPSIVQIPLQHLGRSVLVTCMKYLPCGVIYLLYLVHIS